MDTTMPGFGDTTFIVLLALLLFGPKKLPGLARQLGKLMAEFRRASNEFRTQMEEELRISEQADRQKQVAAIEAAAAKPAQPIPDPEHPHLPPPVEADLAPADLSETNDWAREQSDAPTPDSATLSGAKDLPFEQSVAPNTPERTIAPPQQPVPIATSGDLNLMPPATGLPVARASTAQGHEPAPAPDSEAVHG